MTFARGKRDEKKKKGFTMRQSGYGIQFRKGKGGKASSLSQTRKDSHTIEGVFSEPQIFVSFTSSCKKKRGKSRKAATNIV